MKYGSLGHSKHVTFGITSHFPVFQLKLLFDGHVCGIGTNNPTELTIHKKYLLHAVKSRIESPAF